MLFLKKINISPWNYQVRVLYSYCNIIESEHGLYQVLCSEWWIRTWSIPGTVFWMVNQNTVYTRYCVLNGESEHGLYQVLCSEWWIRTHLYQVLCSEWWIRTRSIPGTVFWMVNQNTVYTRYCVLNGESEHGLYQVLCSEWWIRTRSIPGTVFWMAVFEYKYKINTNKFNLTTKHISLGNA
jgi:hypothetical protein